MKTRRGLLVAGAATAAAAGLGYRAWDRGAWPGSQDSADEPWRSWTGTAAEGLLRLVRAAILAANPHDTQPWIFEVQPGAIAVSADRTRNLGSFDPFRREMHLGIGAAIENLALAAQAYGFAAKIEPVDGSLSLSPDNAPIAAAHVALSPAQSERDALFAAIPDRHTNRGPYRPDQPLDAGRVKGFAERIENDAVRLVFLTDEHARRDLGAIIIEATKRIVDDPEMSADSARWFRTGRREIAAHSDGVTVDTAGLSPFVTAIAKLMPDMDARSTDQYWLAMTRDVQIPTASALGMLFVRDRLDMRSAIAAGRAWQRLHLAATVAGLAAQPLNQPIERMDRDAMLGRADEFGPELKKSAPEKGWEPTFAFRIGFAERPAPPSPRRALEDVVKA